MATKSASSSRGIIRSSCAAWSFRVPICERGWTQGPDGPEHWWVQLTKTYHLWLTPIILNTTDLNAIKIPVLVMAGDHDLNSIEETVEIYRGLEKGQIMIVPGTSHGTMSQRPDLVNLAIREFLDKPETAEGGK